MLIKYHTSLWQEIITKVEIIRETKHQVFVFFPDLPVDEGQRENKQDKHHGYFDTWGEAQEWLISKSQNKVDIAVAQLEDAMAYRKSVFDMQEDK